MFRDVSARKGGVYPPPREKPINWERNSERGSGRKRGEVFKFCQGHRQRRRASIKCKTLIRHLIWGWTGPAYRYQGCYNDLGGPYTNGRTLPQVPDKFRTGVSLDECAAAARNRGFAVFALQGYGQCFFGSMADVASISSSQRLSDGSRNSLPCPASLAAGCPRNINKVYATYGADTPLGVCA
jgi:hypothetical protein